MSLQSPCLQRFSLCRSHTMQQSPAAARRWYWVEIRLGLEAILLAELNAEVFAQDSVNRNRRTGICEPLVVRTVEGRGDLVVGASRSLSRTAGDHARVAESLTVRPGLGYSMVHFGRIFRPLRPPSSQPSWWKEGKEKLLFWPTHETQGA